jgi:hypothetical protein
LNTFFVELDESLDMMNMEMVVADWIGCDLDGCNMCYSCDQCYHCDTGSNCCDQCYS